jgi:hypothetical protein
MFSHFQCKIIGAPMFLLWPVVYVPAFADLRRRKITDSISHASVQQIKIGLMDRTRPRLASGGIATVGERCGNTAIHPNNSRNQNPYCTAFVLPATTRQGERARFDGLRVAAALIQPEL